MASYLASLAEKGIPQTAIAPALPPRSVSGGWVDGMYVENYPASGGIPS